MKIAECKDFKADYPEKYQWGIVDNITASNIGSVIACNIEHELRKPIGQRDAVGGLRKALNIIAEYAEA
jgi:hypothetical protein